MTDDEQMVYCGHICMAAGKLRIAGRMENDHFIWVDRAVGRAIRVGPVQDKKLLLQTACEELSKYFTPFKPNFATAYKV